LGIGGWKRPHQGGIWFGAHVREGTGPVLVRPHRTILYIIHHDGMGGIHPPGHWEWAELATLGELSP